MPLRLTHRWCGTLSSVPPSLRVVADKPYTFANGLLLDDTPRMRVWSRAGTASNNRRAATDHRGFMMESSDR